MLTLPYVFSSGALFQQNSVLTITGTTEPKAKVTCDILPSYGADPSVVFADADGHFRLTIGTPAASFETYTVKITTDAGDEHVMSDVLFGELWMASGQSNMEMPNQAQHKPEQMYDRIRNKKIRVFNAFYPPFGADGEFPYEPDYMAKGQWLSADAPETLFDVSALATAFCDDVYDFLNKNADVPVGFLNVTWGGTSMYAWIPREAYENDEYMLERMKKCGHYRDRSTWNQAGGGNFQQCSAQYNVKIALVEGVRVRGVLWYQGENECAAEYNNRIYADYLRLYYRTYKERFAADPDSFMMFSSLLYLWTYGASGECSYGYLNEAFIETALESPDKFAFMPISDLEPEWSYQTGNHPIHPTHKYTVGARIASLVKRNVYGEVGQKSPATLESYEIDSSRIRLKFRNAGSGLYVKGNLHGMYIAADDGLYLPAECEVISADTLEIWCDEIDAPVHAAYAMQSLEPRTSLFAGDYPVASFYTDHENCLNIEARQWYDTEVETLWANKMHDDVLNFFLHPVWMPICGSEVCRDTAFCRESAASIRVCSDENLCGCRVKSYPYNRLDFAKYAALEVSLYNTNGLTAQLRLKIKDGEHVIPLEKKSDIGGGWSRYRADFGELPEGEIESMIFSFCFENDRYTFVNLEKPRLIRK